MSDREAFEHWYAGHTGDPHIRHYCDSIGRYQFNSMQSAWQAWQAAQAQSVCPHIVSSGEGTSWCRLAAKPQVNIQRLLELLQPLRVVVWEDCYEEKTVVDPDENGDFLYYEAVIAAIAASAADCCGNPEQCWEPCGHLGKDEKYVDVAQQRHGAGE